MTTVLVACGGAGSSVNTPSVPGDGSSSETAPDERASGADWGATDTAPDQAPSCFEKCGALIERADKAFAQAQGRPEGPSRASAFKRAGQAYLLAWRGCSLSIPHGEDLGCPGGREVVPRMVQSFELGKDDAKHILALLIASDRHWRAAGTAPVAPEVLQAVAKRAEAAAAESPKDDAAVQGLEAAAYARIAAGDVAQATRDRDLYRRLAGKQAAQEQALLTVALAAHHNDARQHQRALALLATPPAKVPPRLTVLWYSELGRAQAGLKREAAASRSFSRALATWKQVPSGGAAAEHVGQAMPWPMQGRERVVEAVGAAHFHAGELARARAASLEFPRYQGPKSMQGVAAFVNERIGPYIRERQTIMLEAENAYRKVGEIQPVPPPRYVVASAGAMGEMYAALVEDVVESPIPPHLADDEDVARGYRKTLEESMAPIAEKARRAFTLCRDTAHDLRLEGDFVHRCEAWLREHPAP